MKYARWFMSRMNLEQQFTSYKFEIWFFHFRHKTTHSTILLFFSSLSLCIVVAHICGFSHHYHTNTPTYWNRSHELLASMSYNTCCVGQAEFPLLKWALSYRVSNASRKCTWSDADRLSTPNLLDFRPSIHLNSRCLPWSPGWHHATPHCDGRDWIACTRQSLPS